MNYFLAFIFCGLVCLIGQIILENTKLTPGHITSIFVVAGSILSIFGIYDKLLKIFNMGASIPILSFGNTLTNSAYYGLLEDGWIGLFSNVLCGVSFGISICIFISFIMSLIFKIKD